MMILQVQLLLQLQLLLLMGNAIPSSHSFQLSTLTIPRNHHQRLPSSSSVSSSSRIKHGPSFTTRIYNENNGNDENENDTEEDFVDISQSNNLPDRRDFLTSSSTAAAGLIAAISVSSSSNKFLPKMAFADEADETLPKADLPWKADPINKRSGFTVTDAEKNGVYNIAFVTYLSRFLLNFDKNCQLWWFSSRRMAKTLDKKKNEKKQSDRINFDEEISQIRYEQFAKFSASVEVGLAQSYNEQRFGISDNKGPKKLFKDLLSKYGETKEARRHIALMFSLLEKGQPTDAISELLTSSIQDAKITNVQLLTSGGDDGTAAFDGYDTTNPPIIEFATTTSGGGGGGETTTIINNNNAAKGRAVLKPTGQLLRIDVVDSGDATYKDPPFVIVRSNKKNNNADHATDSVLPKGIAKLDKDGKIESVSLVEAGTSFNNKDGELEFRIVDVNNKDIRHNDEAEEAPPKFSAVLNNFISSIEIIEEGSGYRKDKIVNVFAVSSMKSQQQQKQPRRTLIGTSQPIEVSNSFMGFRDKNDIEKIEQLQTKFRNKYIRRRQGGSSTAIVDDGDDEKAAAAGGASSLKTSSSSSPFSTVALPFGRRKRVESNPGDGSPYDNYFQLLPNGVGIELDPKGSKRYVLAVDDTFQSKYDPSYYITQQQQQQKEGGSSDSNDDILNSSSNNNKGRVPLVWSPNDAFGPRGRSPIERDRLELERSEYARFGLAGAICLSAVCLGLTPLDVIKTKQQSDPSKYTDMGSSIQLVLEDEGGLSGLFTGWAPTLYGNFLSGGAQYALVELARRSLTLGVIGSDGIFVQQQYEIPILLASTALASSVAGIIYCPFEAVRIRTVAQPDYATNAVGTLNRIIQEEGVGSLVNTVPIFLFKYVPYAITKFTVYYLATAKLYELYPAARESIQLSLLISLAGGVCGGTAAAIVSNPSDVIITEVKKSKETDVSVWDAIKSISQRGTNNKEEKEEKFVDNHNGDNNDNMEGKENESGIDDGNKSNKNIISNNNNILQNNPVSPFFVGLPLRIVRYSSLASLSFVAFDSIRFALGIGSDDLKLYLDVLGGALAQQ